MRVKAILHDRRHAGSDELFVRAISELIGEFVRDALWLRRPAARNPVPRGSRLGTQYGLKKPHRDRYPTREQSGEIRFAAALDTKSGDNDQSDIDPERAGHGAVQQIRPARQVGGENSKKADADEQACGDSATQMIGGFRTSVSLPHGRRHPATVAAQGKTASVLAIAS
jgi:hypothetical protein